MKWIVFFILFFITNPIKSQEFTYFNKQLQFPNSNLVVVATLPLTDGYFVLGDNFTEGTHTVFIAKLDLNGDLIWISSLDDSLELGNGGTATGAALIRIDEQHFAALYSKYRDVSFDDMEIALVKFTIEGDVVWQKTYGVEGETLERAYHLLHTKDGGFLLSGLRDIGHFHFLAIKTDSEGAVEWEKTYSLGGTSVAFAAHETLDGGYIFSGYGRSSVTDYDMYCVKTNDKGKLQWQKNYGTENSDLGGQVIPLSTGEYILSGGIRGDNDKTKGYFAKLNSHGNIIWERTYQLLDIASIQTEIIIKPDNGFIGVTVYRNEYGFRHPVIMNFDSRGDTIWTKPITADSSATIYIRDIEKIEGGYVLAGHRFSPTPQYGWILTIDEDGNTCSEGRTYAEVDFEGCDSTVVITNIANTEALRHRGFLKVSPNPARLEARVRYELPIGVSAADLKLYDLQGREIRYWILDNQYSELALDLEGLESGVYFYRVGDRTGKLVVE